jgi:hypothetical protein
LAEREKEKRGKQRRKQNPSCKQAKPEVSTNEFEVRGRISSSLGFNILLWGLKRGYSRSVVMMVMGTLLGIISS